MEFFKENATVSPLAYRMCPRNLNEYVGQKHILGDGKLLRRARKKQGNRTIVFLDEIHRFNKLQQDALLPDVEEGNIILIAATVENPFFYVNSTLLSRSQVFQFKPLSKEELLVVIKKAIVDKEGGLGNLKIAADEDAMQHIAEMSDGEARKALSALEIAALTTPADDNSQQ